MLLFGLPKALWYMLQTLPGAEILSFFIDVHQEPEDPGEAVRSNLYGMGQRLAVRQHIKICVLFQGKPENGPAQEMWTNESFASAGPVL